MTWLAVAAIVVVAIGLYVSWTAQRLDRLHARLDAAAGALHGQLRSRADLAGVIAGSRELPAPVAAGLAAAARTAAATTALGADRERVESALSQAMTDAVVALPARDAERQAVVDAVMRAAIARRIHNDAVRDALVVRRRWIVRLFHLAGHAPRPSYFEMDDAALAITDVARAASPYD